MEIGKKETTPEVPVQEQFKRKIIPPSKLIEVEIFRIRTNKDLNFKIKTI